jgi:glycogen(starch) synthase
MNIKIAILDLDDIRNPLLGAGQAKSTYEVYRRLKSQGYEIEVICSKYPGYRDRTEKGIKYRHIGIGTKNIRLNNAIYILVLPFIIPKIKADLIVECFTAPISTLFTPLFTSIPVIARPTSFEADRFARLYHLPFHWIEALGLKFYKYFLSSVPHFLQKVQSINPHIVTDLAPEGTDAEYLDINRLEAKHILYLGRYDFGQKGIDLLLHAYSKIAGKTKLPLILAGRGPDELPIRDKIKDLQLQTRVSVVGPSFGSNKTKLLQNAACVVIPSRHEGFCIFALEALAAGIPIVTFDIPGLSWLNDDVAIRTEMFDIDGYGENILKVLQPKRNVLMGENAKAFARAYTWDQVAKKYDEFFQRVYYTEYSNHMIAARQNA